MKLKFLHETPLTGMYTDPNISGKRDHRERSGEGFENRRVPQNQLRLPGVPQDEYMRHRLNTNYSWQSASIAKSKKLTERLQKSLASVPLNFNVFIGDQNMAMSSIEVQVPNEWEQGTDTYLDLFSKISSADPNECINIAFIGSQGPDPLSAWMILHLIGHPALMGMSREPYNSGCWDAFKVKHMVDAAVECGLSKNKTVKFLAKMSGIDQGVVDQLKSRRGGITPADLNLNKIFLTCKSARDKETRFNEYDLNEYIAEYLWYGGKLPRNPKLVAAASREFGENGAAWIDKLYNKYESVCHEALKTIVGKVIVSVADGQSFVVKNLNQKLN